MQHRITRRKIFKLGLAGGGTVAATSLISTLPLQAKTVPAAATTEEPTLEQVKAILPQLENLANNLLQKTGVPGMAIAIVYKDQVVYLRGFGVRSVGSNQPVDVDTVFQLASVSKPIASTVIARLVGENVVHWDDPIIQHFPEFQLDQPYVTHSVTLRDMFCHRSGLPDHAGDRLEDIGYGRDEVLQRLRFLTTANRFRAVYDYTNYGITAAAIAAARATGQSWENLSAEKLYRPLGMTSTSSRYADFRAASNRARGHVRLNGQWVVSDKRDPDPQSPAAGVSSNVRDLSRWLQLQLAGGQFAGQQLIPEQVLEETHRPQMVSGYNRLAKRSNFYGLGWIVNYDERGRLRLGHSGAFYLGAATTVNLLPAAGLGIAVLTNAAPIGVPETIAESFMDLAVYGKLQRDWEQIFKQAFAAMAPETTDYSKPPARRTPPLPPSAYSGSYRNDYVGEIAIVSKESGLVLQLGPQKISCPLQHYDRDLFTYQTLGEFGGTLSGVTFTISNQGRAASVILENFATPEGQGNFARVSTPQVS